MKTAIFWGGTSLGSAILADPGGAYGGVLSLGAAKAPGEDPKSGAYGRSWDSSLYHCGFLVDSCLILMYAECTAAPLVSRCFKYIMSCDAHVVINGA